jgi:general secretion pathway protein I
VSRSRRAPPDDAAGFTLVEVLVALMVVAMGLAALMVAVSSTARTSGYLRDKTLAQWIALNRLAEVRLNVTAKFGQNTDAGELNFAGRKWHYDTRYFDTSFSTMRRVVVRVYAGDAKSKGNPVAESSGFLGTALSQPGATTVDWTQGNTAASLGAAGSTGTTSTTSGTTTTSSGTTTTQTNSTAPATGQTSTQ